MTSVCTVTGKIKLSGLDFLQFIRFKGGLTAVIYTETFQAIIMLVGAATVSVKGLIEVGGVHQLVDKYLKAIPSSIPLNKTECAVPKENSFQMLRSIDDPNMPWLGFILGQTPASIWY